MKKIVMLIALILSVINVFGQRYCYVYPSGYRYHVRQRIPIIVEERVVVVEKQPINRRILHFNFFSYVFPFLKRYIEIFYLM